MRHILFLLFSSSFILTSCNYGFKKTVKGNGIVTSEQRSFSSAKKIKLVGGLDLQITQSTNKKVTVLGESNLLAFIETKEQDGWLIIKTKENINLKPNTIIEINIETDVLEAVSVVGSGNINGLNKFEGGEQLAIDVTGSGDVTIATNTPKIVASIAGNGNIILSGETKEASIKIAGSGDYKALDLKTETTKINIAGSGNASVYAAAELDIQIAGSGDISYLGNPNITKKVAGSGKIKQL